MSTWREDVIHTETRQVTGTGTLTATISGAPVEEATDWSLGLHAQQLVIINLPSGHGFAAGSHLYINGTTNYDGVREVTTVTSSGITIKVDKFVAETPAGTETAAFTVAPGADFILLEMNLHLSSASATVENFVVTLDANAGSAYDEVIFTQAMNGEADVSWIGERRFADGDRLDFTHANSNSRTYGLTVKYRRIR